MCRADPGGRVKRFSRLRSRLFTLAAGVSLVLCLATTAMWVRSYWRRDFLIRHPGRADEYSVFSEDGLVSAQQWHYDPASGSFYVDSPFPKFFFPYALPAIVL